jgi:hypothetical protein
MKRGIAIHVGVNHPAGTFDRLSKSEGTAWKLAELSFQAGYRAIHVLCGPQATRRAVGTLLAGTARTLCPGHTLFVSFSGHGSAVPDENGDERDGLDETWCLHDGELVNDELAEYWRLLAPGTRALVVADCCFAGGTVHEGERPMALSGAHAPGAWDGPLYLPGCGNGIPCVSQRIVPPGLRVPDHDDGIQASVLLLAATGEAQRAREGVYVRHLLEVWEGGAFRGSFYELHHRVSDRVRRETYGQDPQMLMLGAADLGFPLEVAFHLERPVMHGANELVLAEPRRSTTKPAVWCSRDPYALE